uniref:hypothetical protein n=1 Tax=Salmonella enterica TaxID=28901 RepID=UPI001FAC91C7
VNGACGYVSQGLKLAKEMADTDVDTTTAEVPVTKDLKEKKEVVEEPEKPNNVNGRAARQEYIRFRHRTHH